MHNSNGSAVFRAVALPALAALFMLAGIIAVVLHFSTSQSDMLAVERQDRMVRLAVQQSVTAVANDQEASTYWDDAVVRTRQRPLDFRWLDNNLGVWFHTYYRHDEAYILDAQNRPIYAMQAGKRVLPAAYLRISSEAGALAQRLRREMISGYLAREGSQGKTVGISDIAVVGGHPAIISLKPIVSETGDIPQAPGSEYLHISVRYLDGSFLAQLSRLYGIDHPVFGRRPSADAAYPIMQANGRTLGFISWTPFRPGEQVEDQMTPVLILSLIAIGALMVLLLLRIWRSRNELEASRALAQHQAFHDGLTGLPNRALFEDRLAHSLSQRGRNVAMLLLDLDRFKHVNDTLGHQAGDALIQEFGLRLTRLTRDGDTVSRLGGDEFAILIENSPDRDVQSLATRILKEVRRPFLLSGAEAYVGVSIGIAVSGAAEVDSLELVRRADIALYRVKDGGRDGYRLFSPDMDAAVKLRGSIEEELRSALTGGSGLSVCYQPQIGRDGKVIGLEALVRWTCPGRGVITPDQFIPIAEETGLIVSLGEWVLAQACAVSRQWPDLFVAVNLSPVQLSAPGFFENLMRTVRTAGTTPYKIQLEVTERVLLDDDDAVRIIVGKLRTAGFTIVLDDFGTGYSSLSYLRKFEVDKVKIDRSFIKHLDDASDSREIVLAVLAMGDAMGLRVSAEGVETAVQQTFLEIAGCREMQGHYFSRALALDELAELLNGGKPSSAAA